MHVDDGPRNKTLVKLGQVSKSWVLNLHYVYDQQPMPLTLNQPLTYLYINYSINISSLKKYSSAIYHVIPNFMLNRLSTQNMFNIKRKYQ